MWLEIGKTVHAAPPPAGVIVTVGAFRSPVLDSPWATRNRTEFTCASAGIAAPDGLLNVLNVSDAVPPFAIVAVVGVPSIANALFGVPNATEPAPVAVADATVGFQVADTVVGSTVGPTNG